MLALGVLEISNVAMSLGELDTGARAQLIAVFQLLLLAGSSFQVRLLASSAARLSEKKAASKSRVRSDDRSAYMGWVPLGHTGFAQIQRRPRAFLRGVRCRWQA